MREIRPEYELIRARLKQMRADAGLTQDEVAEQLGVTRQHITGIERGVSGASIELLTKWTGLFGAPVHAVFMSEGQHRVLTAVERLPESEIELVEQLVHVLTHAQAHEVLDLQRQIEVAATGINTGREN